MSTPEKTNSSKTGALKSDASKPSASKSESTPKPNASKSESTPKPDASKSENTPITQRLCDLDAAVEWFYSDDFNLDQALDRYQSAATLAKAIEQDLNELKNQVELLEDFTKS